MSVVLDVIIVGALLMAGCIAALFGAAFAGVMFIAANALFTRKED